MLWMAASRLHPLLQKLAKLLQVAQLRLRMILQVA